MKFKNRQFNKQKMKISMMKKMLWMLN